MDEVWSGSGILFRICYVQSINVEVFSTCFSFQYSDFISVSPDIVGSPISVHRTCSDKSGSKNHQSRHSKDVMTRIEQGFTFPIVIVTCRIGRYLDQIDATRNIHASSQPLSRTGRPASEHKNRRTVRNAVLAKLANRAMLSKIHGDHVPFVPNVTEHHDGTARTD